MLYNKQQATMATTASAYFEEELYVMEDNAYLIVADLIGGLMFGVIDSWVPNFKGQGKMAKSIVQAEKFALQHWTQHVWRSIAQGGIGLFAPRAAASASA